MGVIRTGILGGVSGKVGPVIGAIVRNVQTIRSRPKKSTKKPGIRQVDQRSKFAIAGKFIRSLNAVVNVGYQSYGNKMTPANAALQNLLENAMIGLSPNFKINFSSVELSKGDLPGSYTMKVLPPVEGGALVFTWNPIEELGDKGSLVRAEDEAVFVVYDEEGNRFLISMRSAFRVAGRKELSLPLIFAGHKLHVWVFFVSPDGKSVSNSQYFGNLVTLP